MCTSKRPNEKCKYWNASVGSLNQLKQRRGLLNAFVKNNNEAMPRNLNLKSFSLHPITRKLHAGHQLGRCIQFRFHYVLPIESFGAKECVEILLTNLIQRPSNIKLCTAIDIPIKA